MKCLQCGKELTNGQKKFCSSSCAAVYNNAHRTKTTKGKTKIFKCVECGCEFEGSIHLNPVIAKCNKCNPKIHKYNDIKSHINSHIVDIRRWMEEDTPIQQIAINLGVECQTMTRYIKSIDPNYRGAHNKKQLSIKQIELMNKLVGQKQSISTIAKQLQVSYWTALKLIKVYFPNYTEEKHEVIKHSSIGKIPLKTILERGSSISNTKIREKLIEEGYKEAKCECCGRSEWMGYPMPLELHHKDFNHWNTNFDNFQILCPNCHALIHKLYKKPG